MSQVTTTSGPPRAAFTLAAGQKIAAAVKQLQMTSTSTSGGRDPSGPVQTQFWAMITSAADIYANFFNWVAVVPNAASAGTGQESVTLSQSNLWKFQVPYVAGFGNAREANGNQQVPQGTVVQLNFIGYAISDGTAGPNAGTITVADTASPKLPNNAIPFYVFSYCMQQTQQFLPLHDHRDPITGGGYAFSIYHPGTSLPQSNWQA